MLLHGIEVGLLSTILGELGEMILVIEIRNELSSILEGIPLGNLLITRLDWTERRKLDARLNLEFLDGL